jgi:hypothetical protein
MLLICEGTDVLTIEEVAKALRCSKSHAARVLRGEVRGLPRLHHVCVGRRKLVRREWLNLWLEESKQKC